MQDSKPHILDFGEPEKENSIIKVIGVGGGGGNAVNHMYREGIHDVSFVLCNTDNQALNDSPVPVHLQLGKEGLGAGNKPEKAKQAAEETLEDIKHMLNDGTKMAFITAGMGGGTGTGAAPVIARVSKELGILTVGIVTIPFKFEQGFRNSVSHGIPSSTFIHGTIYCTICIHGTSKVQHLIFCICGNSHRQQCCGCCCNYHGFSFFVFHFLSPYPYLFVALL